MEIITEQLGEFLTSMNDGEGMLGRIIKDPQLAENLNKTISNLKSSSKGLDENMKAAKSNFLLRGYFKKEAKKAHEDSLKIEKQKLLKKKAKKS